MKCMILLFNILLFYPLSYSTSDDWGYEGANGPEHWGSISQDYKICKDGKRQSPISLGLLSSFFIKPGLVSEWKNTKKNLKYHNNGHSITVDMTSIDVPSFKYNCQELHLKQFHVHTPAEHVIDGHRAALEAHFVFMDRNSTSAQVFGVLFDEAHIDDNHGFFNGLSQSTHPLDNKGDFREFHGLDLGDLFHKVKGFTTGHVYHGSLTTPPCNEFVRFIISDHIQPISKNHLKTIQKAVHYNNARPLQHLTIFHRVGHFDDKYCC